MSISPQKVVFISAALFTILSAIIGGISLLGVWPSLKYDWMRPATPYIHGFLTCIGLLWVIAFVMDYVAIRKAAFAKFATSLPDSKPLIVAEREERIRAIQSLSKDHLDAIHRIEESIRGLDVKLRAEIARVSPRPAPEKSDYEETVLLRNDLQTFLDEAAKQPRADFKLPHDKFNERLYAMGAFEHWLTHSFQLKFSSRLETLIHRLAVNHIGDGELEQVTQRPPKDLATVKQITDRLSVLINEQRNLR